MKNSSSRVSKKNSFGVHQILNFSTTPMIALSLLSINILPEFDQTLKFCNYVLNLIAK
jgi:hypothetical protein